MTYSILQISRAAYNEVRARIVAIDAACGGRGDYTREFIRPPGQGKPELLVMGQLALQALEPGEKPRVGGDHYVAPEGVTA